MVTGLGVSCIHTARRELELEPLLTNHTIHCICSVTNPSFLSTLARINQNKSSFKPEAATVLVAYKAKHRKLPTLGEDVTDDDEGDADDEEDDDDEYM